MNCDFLDILYKKPFFKINFSADYYFVFKNRYQMASPKEKGIIIELIAINLISRISGKEWLGSHDRYEYFDACVDEIKIDFKSSSSQTYSLKPSDKQQLVSKFFGEKIYYLLINSDFWDDQSHSVYLRFEDSALLENGTLKHLKLFTDSKKRFVLESFIPKGD